MRLRTALRSLFGKNNPYRKPAGPGNPYHKPAGPGGGQFTHRRGAGATFNAESKSWQKIDGTTLDADTAKRLKGIPKGWHDVQLNPDPKGALQVAALDSKNRRVSRYSKEHSEQKSKEKFDRVKEFGALHGQLTDIAAKDALKGNDDAAAMLLVAVTGMRIGSTRDTKAEKKAFGASTLLASHVVVKGDTTKFAFGGKKGVNIELNVNDKTLAKVLKSRMKDRAPNEPLFNTSDQKVRDYMVKNGAKGFTPKDFRTHLATSVAKQMTYSMPRSTTFREFAAARLKIAKAVSKLLGNTPAMALASYIDSTVWGSLTPLKP